MAKYAPQIDQSDPQAKIIIDWQEFDKLCSLMATEEEIAGWFGCSVQTLCDRCKDKFGVTFQEIYKEKSSRGTLSLRRAQFQSALGIKEDGEFSVKPSTTMQIWLGKQYLGQRDKTEVEQRNVNLNASITDKELERIIEDES